MKSVKKLLRYAVPGIALMLLFGFALACGGEPSTEEVSKVVEEPTVEEEEKAVEEIKKGIDVRNNIYKKLVLIKKTLEV